MSDMTSFTIRDLDRIPRKVLDASIRDGRAVVRARSGEAFLITPLVETNPVPDESAGIRWIEAHRQWRATHQRRQVPAAMVAEVDRLLAGE